jgi:hypothetical protein
MRSAFQRCLVALSLMNAPVVCLAQATPEWHHYKLIDLGTFGGPDSLVFFIQHVLTENGIVVGVAETNIPDPFTTSCPSPNCKITYGFVWRDGVRTKLPGLVRGALTEAQSVNERGTVAGDSRDGTADPGSGSAVTKATVWRNGRIISLGTLGGPSSSVSEIDVRIAPKMGALRSENLVGLPGEQAFSSLQLRSAVFASALAAGLAA